MKPLRPEQLEIIAEEFARSYPAHVRSYSALVAAAAIPGARVHGLSVFDDAGAAADALEHTIKALKPLSDHNDHFASVAREVYLEWCLCVQEY